MSLRVMIVDDHEVVRLGYASLLQAHSLYAVDARFGDGTQAYQALLEADAQGALPDVLVCDLSLNGASGITLITRVTERFPSLRILALSMHESGAMIQRALDAGARGFLAKSAPPALLRTAIESLAAGRSWLDESCLRALEQHRQARNTLDSLTAREWEVLQLLLRGDNYLGIAHALHLSVKTIANHLSAIRGKLGADTDFQLIRILENADRQGLQARPST